jgi:hypothetical protein
MFIFLTVNANSSYVLNFFSKRRILLFENEACNIKLLVGRVVNLENNDLLFDTFYS